MYIALCPAPNKQIPAMNPVSLNKIQRFGFVLAAATVLIGCGRENVVTSADGIRIAYDARGEGTPGAPTLVFVHGWSNDRSYWSGQLQPFAQEFRVVAVDLAGHGESGFGQRTAWTMQAFGGDVTAVVEKLGLQRVILIGHSMGGDVIVEAARRLPGRVAGLVWVDTHRQLGTAPTPEEIRTMAAPFHTSFAATTRAFVRGMFLPNADSSLVERVALDMSSAPPVVAIATMESAISFDSEIPRALQELKLPVVAINPDYRPTDVESMQRSGVEVVLMSGVGHFLMMEDPERFNTLLRTVVDKLGR